MLYNATRVFLHVSYDHHEQQSKKIINSNNPFKMAANNITIIFQSHDVLLICYQISILSTPSLLYRQYYKPLKL